MHLQRILAKLIDRNDLTAEEARYCIELITSEVCLKEPVQIGALLALLASKKETITEILTFAQCIRERAVNIPLNEDKMLDIVGTGGDGANTVNISTAASILAAACGAKVAKHGNRSFSSRSGSADVLEKLDIPMLSKPQEIATCLEKAKIAFIYAPNFHPCLKFVGSARKALKIRTIFNVLGPLVNPAHCSRIVIGVYTPKLLDSFGEIIKALGVEHGLVIHCAGLDELNSLGEPADIVEVRKGEPIHRYRLKHEDIGIPRLTSIQDLVGGDADDNATIIRRVLSKTPTEQDLPLAHTIAYNTGAGLYVYGIAKSIKEGYEIAFDVLKKGKALQVLTHWSHVSQDILSRQSE